MPLYCNDQKLEEGSVEEVLAGIGCDDDAQGRTEDFVFEELRTLEVSSHVQFFVL